MTTAPRRCFSTTLVLALLLGLPPGSALARQFRVPPLDPANFSNPQNNTFLPMTHGLTYAYEAEEEDGLVRNEVTQTFDTKVILGVTTTVVHDTERIFIEGVGWIDLEDTFDWIAWDNFGNVWYLGEFTTEFLYDEDWNPVGTSNEGSWEAGVDGAVPGILMLANPRPGTIHRQEFYAGVAEDMAQVLRRNVKVVIDLATFTGCVKTKEWTPLERGHIEHKFYAPNVGLVLIIGHHGKRIITELVDIFPAP